MVFLTHTSTVLTSRGNLFGLVPLPVSSACEAFFDRIDRVARTRQATVYDAQAAIFMEQGFLRGFGQHSLDLVAPAFPPDPNQFDLSSLDARIFLDIVNLGDVVD